MATPTILIAKKYSSNDNHDVRKNICLRFGFRNFLFKKSTNFHFSFVPKNLSQNPTNPTPKHKPS